MFNFQASQAYTLTFCYPDKRDLVSKHTLLTVENEDGGCCKYQIPAHSLSLSLSLSLSPLGPKCLVSGPYKNKGKHMCALGHKARNRLGTSLGLANC